MRFTTALPLALVAALSCLGQSFAVTSHHAGNTAANSEVANQRNGEIVAALIAVNNNEIVLAKDALKKAKNKEVRQYAHMLKKAHESNLKKTLKIAKKIGVTPVVTAKVKGLKEHGKQVHAKLAALQGVAFEKAYVDAMIKGHQAVLVLFDTKLLKEVSNPQLKEHLIATRPHIQAHLQQGEVVRKNLK